MVNFILWFSIIGSTIYAFGRSVITITIARFMIGIVWGIEGALVDKIVRLTPDGKHIL